MQEGKDTDLEAPFIKSSGTICYPLAPFKDRPHRGMRFEPLEFLEGAQIWIAVVQSDHETGSHQRGALIEVIDKGTTIGVSVL